MSVIDDVDDGSTRPSTATEAESCDAAQATNPSKMALRSAAASTGWSRPSLAKGSSKARPRWSRPQQLPSIPQAALLDAGCSDNLSKEAQVAAALDQPVSTRRPHADQVKESLTPSERLARLSQYSAEHSTFNVKDFERPPTPSTISDAGLSGTLSSLSSRPTTRSSASSFCNFGRDLVLEDGRQHDSGLNSRPTSSSAFSARNSKTSAREVTPEDERFHVLIDCTRESRIRASGSQLANPGSRPLTPSVKTAWGPEVVEEA